MKGKIALAALAAFAIGWVACTHKSSAEEHHIAVMWEAENLGADSVGVPHYRQTFRIAGPTSALSRLCFNQFARRMAPVDGSDTIVEIVPGYYAIATPRLAAKADADTLVIDIITRGTLRSICYAPDGVHAVDTAGRTVAVLLQRFDISSDPRFYADEKLDRMPYGEEIFAQNEALASGYSPGIYDVVPSFKSIVPTGGESLANPAQARFVDDNSMGANAWKAVVSNGEITVYAPARRHQAVRRQLLRMFGNTRRSMPNAILLSDADLEYRGLMIDVARNFQSVGQIKRVLDLMAAYNLNTLHFHIVDDEAWRLEIDALPELTAVGARRGYVTDSIAPFLPQIFAGNGNPDAVDGTANGYYSREQFIDILRYADSLAIKVIPEIESPGHARAAIKAMQYRSATVGDNRYLLSESGDTSRYTSAQSFHDNVMNPALESTYAFLDVVFDEIIDMHKEALGPDAVPVIHIGGDEVPRNAWSGSKSVQQLMYDRNLKTEKDVHAYFVRRLSDMLENKGVQLAGWQEIAVGHSEDYNNAVRPNVYSVNCWSTLPSQGQGGVVQAVAESGYPVILSNVDHFYLDMTYSYHPDERGLSWGGTTDEFSALHGYARRLCPFPGADIKGIQAQVFAETIRDTDGLETMLLPKLVGLSERACNVDSTYTDNQFMALVARDMRRWDADGYAFHVRQPGIHIIDNGTAFQVNTPYPEAVVRYTLDGTRPTPESPVAIPGTSVAIGPDVKIIRATTFFGSRQSVPSITIL